MMPTTWENVYSSYNEIKKQGTSEFYEVEGGLLSKKEVIDAAHENDSWQLLKDNLTKDSNKTTKILEFGGDLGNAWVVIKEICDVEYHIIETEKFTKHGREIFPEINWHTEIPTLKNSIDILYTRTSLQYLEDMDKYLSDCICKTSPKKIIIDHQCFTPIETFWSHQKYRDLTLAWCFKNFKEFDSNIRQHGYELIYEYNDERYDYSKRVNFPKENMYPYLKSLVYEIVDKEEVR